MMYDTPLYFCGQWVQYVPETGKFVLIHPVLPKLVVSVAMRDLDLAASSIESSHCGGWCD